METLPVKGCKIWAYARRSGPLQLWAGRDLYRATPAVTRDLGFSSLIRRITPFSRLLRHTRERGGPILTRMVTGYRVRKFKFAASWHACSAQLFICLFFLGVGGWWWWWNSLYTNKPNLARKQSCEGYREIQTAYSKYCSLSYINVS
jgi:hypothetical protein